MKQIPMHEWRPTRTIVLAVIASFFCCAGHAQTESKEIDPAAYFSRAQAAISVGEVQFLFAEAVRRESMRSIDSVGLRAQRLVEADEIRQLGSDPEAVRALLEQLNSDANLEATSVATRMEDLREHAEKLPEPSRTKALALIETLGTDLKSANGTLRKFEMAIIDHAAGKADLSDSNTAALAKEIGLTSLTAHVNTMRETYAYELESTNDFIVPSLGVVLFEGLVPEYLDAMVRAYGVLQTVAEFAGGADCSVSESRLSVDQVIVAKENLDQAALRLKDADRAASGFSFMLGMEQGLGMKRLPISVPKTAAVDALIEGEDDLFDSAGLVVDLLINSDGANFCADQQGAGTGDEEMVRDALASALISPGRSELRVAMYEASRQYYRSWSELVQVSRK